MAGRKKGRRKSILPAGRIICCAGRRGRSELGDVISGSETPCCRLRAIRRRREREETYVPASGRNCR